jgi:hypothetical protein
MEVPDDNVKVLAKVLIKSLVFVAALYACFRYLGDFSSQQSAVLAFVGWVGYGLYEKLNVSRRVDNVFSPFCVSILPNWYQLLSDFRLIRSEEQWHRLDNASDKVSADNYSVFHRGFVFTVIKPAGDEGLLPGLTFWDNRKTFLSELELSESIIEVRDESAFRLHLGEEHPYFKHPRWAGLPEVYFKWGVGGYELGLEVQDNWWEELCNSGEIGELAKLQQHRDHPCGTTKLVIATLPYSEFGVYYQNRGYDQIKKQQAARDKQLEANGWKRKIEGDSEIRDPWSHIKHKYFTVSHRAI